MDEIRAEGDGSPLPSGVWTTTSSSATMEKGSGTISPNLIHNNQYQQQQFKQGPTTSPQDDPDLRRISTGSNCNPYGNLLQQSGNAIGKIGSACCGGVGIESLNNNNDENCGGGRRSNNHKTVSENTYKSFGYGEDLDVYEALASPNSNRRRKGSPRGNLKRGPTPPPGVETDDGENEVGKKGEAKNKGLFTPSQIDDEDRIFYPHRTFKVILAGDAAVGKTTFIERICNGHFTPNLSSTIGRLKNLLYKLDPCKRMMVIA